MAALGCDGSDLIDLNVDQFFDIERYYGKESAEPQGAPPARSQILSDPRPSSRISRSEPYYEHVETPEVATVSQSYADDFTDSHPEFLQAPSKHHTTIGNEPFPQYGQSSIIGNPNAKLHHIENELEEVELRLKRRELQRRRQELLRPLPTERRAQTSEHPQVQKNGTAMVSPMNRYVDQPYNTPNKISVLGSLQQQIAGIDSRYGEHSIDPLYFGFNNLLSNPQGVLSCLGVPEQLDKSDARLLSLGSTDIPNSMPAPPPASSRQEEMQTSIPAFSSEQASWQSLSASPQHEQSLDTTHRVSTFSSTQQDQAVHSPDMSVIIRKRPRLPQPPKARPLSAIQHELARRTGVPEVSLGVMCFNTEPLRKRNRTGSQKQNKKDVQSGGGSCFLCFISKKKCSGQRPCETCTNYWQKRIHDSTSFTWTCDVRSKLSDLNIFKYPLVGTSNSAFHDTFASQLDGVDIIMQNFEELFGLRHPLDPKLCVKTVNSSTELQNIVHWARLQVCLIPNLQHDLSFLKSLYRYNSSYIFDDCDQAHMSPHKERAVMLVVLTFHEIKRLKDTEILDLAVADHLLLAMKGRLKIFCSRIFDFDESKEFTRDRGQNFAAELVDSVPELSSCLPPHYRGCSCRSDLLPKYNKPLDSSAVNLGLPSCLLRRSDSSECCYDNAQTDSCCCGWTFDIAPSDRLNLFGHSAKSFARYVHSKPWKAGFDKVGFPVNRYKALETLLREPWIDNLSLPQRMSGFEQILSNRFSKESTPSIA
ncbi:hypothetical protein BDR22DRAFT_689918 [Usnea florida]